MGKVKKRRSSVEIPRTETGRKKPMCGRCEVHGVIVLLEGHKMYCKFQKCTCDDCYNFLMQQRIAADNIARKRANKLSKEKKISHVEMLPLSLLTPKENNGLSELVIYTLEEMYKSFTVWRSPTKIERILRILVKYAREIDSRIKFNGFLEYFKDSIFKATIIRHLKIIRQNFVQNIILLSIIIYLIYYSFLFKYYLFPPWELYTIPKFFKLNTFR